MDQLVNNRWPFTGTVAIIASDESTVLITSNIIILCGHLCLSHSSFFQKVKKKVICYKESINPAVWLPLDFSNIYW